MTDKERSDLKQKLDKLLEPYEKQAKLWKNKGEKSSKGFSAAMSTIGIVGALTATPFVTPDPVEADIIDVAGTAMISGLNATHLVTGLFGGSTATFRLVYLSFSYQASVFTDYGALSVYRSGGSNLARFSFSNSLIGTPALGGGGFISVNGNAFNSWDDSGAYYVGLKKGLDKAWIKFDFDIGTPGDPSSRKMTIGPAAYSTGGMAITAGETSTGKGGQPIPEPGTLATLALGAAGLFAWRRHRQKQAEKAKEQATTTDDNDLMMS